MPSKRKGVTLILVDDDVDLLNALTFSFETEGYDVRAYLDGDALIEAGELDSGACIVIDEKLIKDSGLDLLDRLRACGLAAPAILITTNPTERIRLRAAASGVEIVEKPLLGSALSDKIIEVLGRP